MFKLIAGILIIYFYYSTLICYESTIKVNKTYGINLLVDKVLSNELISTEEKNRLYNFIDYKLSKNLNDTTKWLGIKEKLDI